LNEVEILCFRPQLALSGVSLYEQAPFGGQFLRSSRPFLKADHL
jgi:hypothetical protein